MARNAIRILGVLLLFLGALLVMQPLARADVTLTLTGTATGFTQGGVYTSPYEINVGGIGTLALTCDDYLTDIYFNESWSAVENNLTSVAQNGPQKFDGLGGTTVAASYDATNSPLFGDADLGAVYTIQDQYYAAAYLAGMILNDYQGWVSDVKKQSSNVAADSTQAAELSYALWTVFDPNAMGQAGFTQAQENQSYAYMFNALNGIYSGSITTVPNIVLYTPDPNKGAAQEFLGLGSGDDPISVPEGSTPATLGFDLLALFAGIFLVRRRILAN